MVSQSRTEDCWLALERSAASALTSLAESGVPGGRDVRLACGVDVVGLEAFERSLEVGGPAFLQRVFTQREQTLCGGEAPRLAARFAGKEATAKALGVGFRGLDLVELEVLADEKGQPGLVLHGRAADLALQLGLDQWAVSLTHSPPVAMAIVIGSGVAQGRDDRSALQETAEGWLARGVRRCEREVMGSGQ